jgi:catechol 2,3-dioxygenase-like lactoylglutathione lyase family enzyme
LLAAVLAPNGPVDESADFSYACANPTAQDRSDRNQIEAIMQIKLASVMVDDQEKALNFYTSILGFVKKNDIPMGSFRWLTVTAPEGAEGVELVLEPLGFPPAKDFQKALFEAGIPATAFLTSDIQAEYRRLKELGVSFRGEPKSMGPITAVTFEDTCGNLINLVQPAA